MLSGVASNLLLFFLFGCIVVFILAIFGGDR